MFNDFGIIAYLLFKWAKALSQHLAFYFNKITAYTYVPNICLRLKTKKIRNESQANPKNQ